MKCSQNDACARFQRNAELLHRPESMIAIHVCEGARQKAYAVAKTPQFGQVAEILCNLDYLAEGSEFELWYAFCNPL